MAPESAGHIAGWLPAEAERVISCGWSVGMSLAAYLSFASAASRDKWSRSRGRICTWRKIACDHEKASSGAGAQDPSTVNLADLGSTCRWRRFRYKGYSSKALSRCYLRVHGLEEAHEPRCCQMTMISSHKQPTGAEILRLLVIGERGTDGTDICGSMYNTASKILHVSTRQHYNLR